MSQFLAHGSRNGLSVALARAGGAGRRVIGAAALGLLASVLLPLVAGCEPSGVIEINDPEQFRREVLESDRPVLVDFYKKGCPTCLPLDPVFEQLAKDYDGRAKIARFMIMTPWWTFPYWDFKQEHRIYYVPEVLLFNKGVEVKRWPMMYFIGVYRDALDKLVPPPGAAPLASAPPPRYAAPPPAATPPPRLVPAPAPARTPAGDRVP